MKEINWKDLFEAMPFPCIVLEPKGHDNFLILEVNQSFLDLTGVSREELLYRNSREAFPPNPNFETYGYDLLKPHLEKAIETGEKQIVEDLRYDILNKSTGSFDERYFTSQNIPFRNNEGKTQIILSAVQETTQEVKIRKQDDLMQEEFNANRQHFRNFIKANPDGLFRLDLAGNFLHVNKGLSNMAELPVEELTGNSFIPFCAPQDEKLILKHFELAKAGKINSYEANFISASGKTVVLKILLMPMFIDNKVVEVHGIAKDVTDFRKTEKIMVEKSRFLEVNAAFISSLLENEINDQALHEAFGIIAQTIGAGRMYYFGADKNKDTGEILISQKVEWCSGCVKSQSNNPDMQNMPISKVEEISAPLIKNLPFTARLEDLAPGAMKEIFIEQEIRSMLLLPISLEDGLYGFVGFDDCSQARIWKEEEISFLKSLTHNLTNVLEKRVALDRLKNREQELIQSEQKFRALVQEGSDLIGILDIDGFYSFASENYKNILGLQPSDLVGKNAYHFIHPEDIERVREQFLQLKEQKQVKISPFRFKDSSGDYRWVQTVATNLLNDSAVNGIVANSRDVTTIIEQGQEIERINERYQLAATATQDLIYDWDLTSNKVTRFHRSLDELFGHSSEEVNRKEFWLTHIHPEDLAEEKRKLTSTLQDPEENFIKTEYRFRRADGSYARVVDKGYIIRDCKGNAIRLIGATSDVSEMNAKKEALKVANERFKIAMKATNEMIWDWDVATNYVTRSKGYRSIFGYDTNESTSLHTFWVDKIALDDKEKVKCSLNAALQNPNIRKWRMEYRFIKADGKIAYINDRGYILRDKNGKATRVVGAALDVTNSRRLMRKIQKQNTVLKQIAWEQSHVVRAPLARIKGLLHLLEYESCEEIDRKEILCHMKCSADELDNIIRKIVRKTEKIDAQRY